MQEAYVGVTQPNSNMWQVNSCHVVAVVSFRQDLFLVNLGKNRAYLLNDGKARQLTINHRRDEPQEAVHMARFMPVHPASRAAAAADSSRVLIDRDSDAAWQPQITQLALEKAAGGIIVMMSQSVAELINMADMRRLAVAALNDAEFASTKNQLVSMATNRASGGELGLAFFNVIAAMKEPSLWF